jgi:diaminohydroxyphosphoribosylaminopyrimidine deaminase / 5-amino-6-(5-phosphoribosylamino)uracil reductase
MKDQHHHPSGVFMQRAMDLALLGLGSVSPNPLVGCVIVVDNKIIGEGYHRKYGEAHAEVNAVNTVADKTMLSRATVYVNLEPCSHYGKTPPCADLLAKHNVKKVVIANVDSNPLVGGKGISKLKEAGVEVETGLLEQEGRELNKRFFTFIEKQRPFIILKWAQTADGYIARENYDSKWISGETSRQLVHRWRAEEPAILVGKNTALYDNPQLNVRTWSGQNPVRIVIDKNLTLPKSLKVFDGTQRTLVYNIKTATVENTVEYVKLSEQNLMNELLNDLFAKGVQSVIVEGGSETLQHFIKNNLWDEARIFTSQSQFEKGVAAPKMNGKVTMEEKIGDDILKVYRNNSHLWIK